MTGDGAAAIAAYRATLAAPLRQVTLCFLLRDQPGPQVLLALKKRGFGAGKWAGVGGKPLPGETIEAAAQREAREEIGVVVGPLEQVATISYYFPHAPPGCDWDQQSCVFLTRDWDGAPVETEEMAPRWFDLAHAPLDAMWADARYWAPRLWAGERLTASFLLDATNEGVAAYDLTPGAAMDASTASSGLSRKRIRVDR